MKIFALLLVSAALFNSVYVLGLSNGQKVLLQASLQAVQEDFAESQGVSNEIIAVLNEHGVPYDESRLKWALWGSEASLTDDDIDFETDPDALLRKTHIIFLQDDASGLQRIYAQHGGDFKRKERREDKEAISKFIEETMKGNDPEEVTKCKSGGISMLYPTRSETYLRVITSSEGSINTAYPMISTEWDIRIDQAGITLDQLFSVTDRSAPIRKTLMIHLRESSSTSGLKHVYFNHVNEFERLEGISKHAISKFIKDTMTLRGNPEEVTRNDLAGIEVLYKTIQDHYFRVIVAADGYIITAYPIASKEVEWEISIDQAGITQDDVIAATDQNAPLLETHMIFLREGTSTGGLKHINMSHATDFKGMVIDSKEGISKYIKDTMEEHTQVEVVSTESKAIQLKYKISKNNYLILVVGKKGFIVTAYPRTRVPVVWRITLRDARMEVEKIKSITGPGSLLSKYQIILLREGDSFTGLQHIFEKHGRHFESLLGIHTKEGISAFIKRAMETTPHGDTIRSECGGIFVLYQIRNERYLRVITDSKGLIITAFPRSTLDVEWSIETSTLHMHRLEPMHIMPYRVYLGEGHKKAGLQHIYEQHAEVFKQLEELNSAKKVSKFIRRAIENVDLVQVKRMAGEREKINMIFELSDNNYLRVITSSSGFIITAYPMPGQEDEWRIRTHQTGIRQHDITSKIPAGVLDFNHPYIFLTEGNEYEGLTYIHETKGIEFKNVKGIDSKEGISKFIKNTLETCRPIDYMAGRFKTLNVLYMTNNAYLLVKFSRHANISSASLKVRLDRDHLSWSITTSEAGITDEIIESHTFSDAPLLHNHLIFLNKEGLRKIHENGFKKQRSPLSNRKILSEFIRDTMMKRHRSAKFFDGLKSKSLVARYMTRTNNHLDVVISSNGYIISVYYKQDK